MISYKNKYKNKYKKYKLKYLALKKESTVNFYNKTNNNDLKKDSKKIDIYKTKKFIIQKYKFDLKNLKECKNNKYGKKYLTNKKFDIFDQIFYHAGDKEDFEKYGLKPIFNNFTKYKVKNIDLSQNIYRNFDVKISDLFNNIDYNTVKNSFNYYFNKFKKCIFVAIKDNKLLVFLPISKANYKNNFLKYLYFDGEDKKNLNELELLQKKNNKSSKDKKRINVLKDITLKRVVKFNKENKSQVLHDRSRWIANNCFFRNNYPEYEGEKLVPEYEWFFINLLKNRKVPDMIFFLNIRDHQYLKDNLTEPYNYIYESNDTKIEQKYIFESYLPLLSIGSKDLYADIPIPTQDDIQRISNILFSRSCNKSYSIDGNNKLENNWENKKEKAIFMGQATGCGINIDTNMRLKAASISQTYPDYLKVGITDWNNRLKKEKNGPLKILEKDQFNFKLSKTISRKEISLYKYILLIDGHITAFRLSFELSFNSVILLVESNYFIWFSKLLKPYEHYVPIKSDLSDLIDKIKWCKRNDKKCHEIAKNAKFFYDKYLSDEGMFDYMQSLFVKLSKRFKTNFFT